LAEDAPWLTVDVELDPEEAKGPHLITVDELRAAGALDVPPAWRKSLGAGVERDLFSGLFDDDDSIPDEQQLTDRDPDGDAAADDPESIS
jgi:hypothetical protein